MTLKMCLKKITTSVAKTLLYFLIFIFEFTSFSFASDLLMYPMGKACLLKGQVKNYCFYIDFSEEDLESINLDQIIPYNDEFIHGEVIRSSIIQTPFEPGGRQVYYRYEIEVSFSVSDEGEYQFNPLRLIFKEGDTSKVYKAQPIQLKSQSFLVFYRMYWLFVILFAFLTVILLKLFYWFSNRRKKAQMNQIKQERLAVIKDAEKEVLNDIFTSSRLLAQGESHLFALKIEKSIFQFLQIYFDKSTVPNRDELEKFPISSSLKKSLDKLLLLLDEVKFGSEEVNTLQVDRIKNLAKEWIKKIVKEIELEKVRVS